MNLDRVDAGRDLADDFNVIVEIPMNADPIKYEIDKATGALFVDRFLSTAMHYPCNYGYIPHTISDDGDPVDVLVVSPFALMPGVVVRCRPIGMLKMTDEAGGDHKLIAVHRDDPDYAVYQDIEDLPQHRLLELRRFFLDYKKLEGKEVTVDAFLGPAEAMTILRNAVELYRRKCSGLRTD